MNIKLNKGYINELLEYEKVQNGLYVVATPIGNLGDITSVSYTHLTLPTKA